MWLKTQAKVGQSSCFKGVIKQQTFHLNVWTYFQLLREISYYPFFISKSSQGNILGLFKDTLILKNKVSNLKYMFSIMFSWQTREYVDCVDAEIIGQHMLKRFCVLSLFIWKLFYCWLSWLWRFVTVINKYTVYNDV